MLKLTMTTMANDVQASLSFWHPESDMATINMLVSTVVTLMPVEGQQPGQAQRLHNILLNQYAKMRGTNPVKDTELLVLTGESVLNVLFEFISPEETPPAS